MSRTQFSRTWWGKNFIEALEPLMDSGRLSRGRSYARNGKVIKFDIEKGVISAKVRGSINPYFGVYKEPLYKVTIQLEAISEAKWAAAIALIASKASLISQLLLKVLPDNIEANFKILGLPFLPSGRKDLHTNCSCPDYSNPCKHVAGVYFLIAEALDQDPFILFELRGLPREKLFAELAKSPLGQAIAGQTPLETPQPDPVQSFFTEPIAIAPDKNLDLQHFWHGHKRLPSMLEPLPQVPLAGVPIRKQGDYPSFWDRDNSFVEAMEQLYTLVKTKGYL